MVNIRNIAFFFLKAIASITVFAFLYGLTTYLVSVERYNNATSLQKQLQYIYHPDLITDLSYAFILSTVVVIIYRLVKLLSKISSQKNMVLCFLSLIVYVTTISFFTYFAAGKKVFSFQMIVSFLLLGWSSFLIPFFDLLIDKWQTKGD